MLNLTFCFAIEKVKNCERNRKWTICVGHQTNFRQHYGIDKEIDRKCVASCQPFFRIQRIYQIKYPLSKFLSRHVVVTRRKIRDTHTLVPFLILLVFNHHSFVRGSWVHNAESIRSNNDFQFPIYVHWHIDDGTLIIIIKMLWNRKWLSLPAVKENWDFSCNKTQTIIIYGMNSTGFNHWTLANRTWKMYFHFTGLNSVLKIGAIS